MVLLAPVRGLSSVLSTLPHSALSPDCPSQACLRATAACYPLFLGPCSRWPARSRVIRGLPRNLPALPTGLRHLATSSGSDPASDRVTSGPAVTVLVRTPDCGVLWYSCTCFCSLRSIPPGTLTHSSPPRLPGRLTLVACHLPCLHNFLWHFANSCSMNQEGANLLPDSQGEGGELNLGA